MCAEKDEKFDLSPTETNTDQTNKDPNDDLDLLPEFCHYKDEGCAMAKACLECPLPACVYDTPGGRAKLLKSQRNEDIRRIRMTKPTLTNKEIAKQFNLTERMVYNILNPKNRESKANNNTNGEKATIIKAEPKFDAQQNDSHLFRPYQIEAGRAIMDSVTRRKGLTFTLEIARQGGKNELSAHLESLLLGFYQGENKNLIKCSPTFKPQTVISMQRLKEKLNAIGFAGRWASEMGYIIRLGNAKAIFLSAEESANVVGNTAHLLLEVDEAQDVSEEKFLKEFKPMGATTNVTTVLYGTTWDENTLLERMKQVNLELERKDGIQRHFRYDWQVVGQYNPLYLAYAEEQRARLGENHPLFMTQYRLLPLHGGGGFLNRMQQAQLQGEHSRRKGPESGKVYVAGIDLAGEAENEERDWLKDVKMKQDATVVTIGEIEADLRFKKMDLRGREGDWIPASAGMEHKIKIVEQYEWRGVKHAEVYARLVDLLRNVWHCKRVVVDSTGIGQPVASFLRQALGSRVVPFTFTAPAKSELGFNLLAAINSGSLKMYGADNSPEYREFWSQIEKAKGYYRPSQTMNFYVDPAEGHDDYLMSLALVVEAAREYRPREAVGRQDL